MFEQFFQDLLRFPFLQNAVFASVLASIACGIVGSLVVVRRSTYIAGSISHTALGGMGVARYLERVHSVAWLTPLLGAAAASVLAALLISAVSVRRQQRVDTVLSALWAIGMAVGITFITATPGYNEDLMSYLFGNILLVTSADLWLIGLLNLVVVTSTVLLYNKLVVVSFHEELARLRGLPVGLLTVTLLLLTALTVVLLVQVVGIVMVIALLTLPAATAGFLTRHLWAMMLVSIGFSLLFTLGGLLLSYQPELPPGATIIELAGATYLLTLGSVKLRQRFR